VKRVLSIILVFIFLSVLTGCGNNIPTLEEVSQMNYEEVNKALVGRTYNEVRDVWGEPASSDEIGESWPVDSSMIVVIQYDKYTDSGIVESCELICGTPLAPTE